MRALKHTRYRFEFSAVPCGGPAYSENGGEGGYRYKIRTGGQRHRGNNNSSREKKRKRMLSKRKGVSTGRAGSGGGGVACCPVGGEVVPVSVPSECFSSGGSGSKFHQQVRPLIRLLKVISPFAELKSEVY